MLRSNIYYSTGKTEQKTGFKIMKRSGIILLLVMFIVSLAEAQTAKKYDDLDFPELNEFQRPEVETFSLDNGITFYLVEDRELPLIDVGVRIRTGGVLVPNEKAGLASITGTVIRSGGSESWPADSLNELLENRAASIETGIGFTSGSASMSVLKEDFDRLAPVLVDLLVNPAFPEDKIELAKTQTKTSISRRNDNNQQIGFREFQRLIYGENSVYGRNTEYETVNNITREDLVEFHKEHFEGNNMMVGIVGDFDSDEMKQKLGDIFGSIPAGEETNLVFPEVDYDYMSSINFIHKSDVNQSFVLLGHLGGLRENPDYPQLQVMNQVLSGGFSGRLFQVVRSDMGLAYSVFGQYGMNTFYPGQFYAGVMTKSETTAEAIDAIIEQIRRIQEEPVTEEELRKTKDQFLNSLVFRYDSYEKVLNQRLSDEYRGLPDDAFDKYVEGVRNTTAEDVQRVARKYLQPDNMQILVVGNRNEIGDQLEKYGEVNEIDITIPQPGDDAPAAKGDAARGRELLDRMAGALISSDTELDKLSMESEITQYNEQIPGGSMTMQAEQVIDYPDAIEQTLKTPQGEIEMSYKDGSGTMRMGGNEQPLPPQYVQNLKESLNRTYIAVAINRENYDPQFLGMEEFEGTQYAAVSLEIDDKEVTFLIDPETALPRLMRYRQFNPQAGEQVQVEDRYADWKTIDGITYAHRQESYVDGEKQTEATYENVQPNPGEQ